MKKQYLRDLQSNILGSVNDNPDVLDYFSTDGSIFKIVPEGVVYPLNTADVRKVVSYIGQEAQKGKKLSIIPRGKGSDLSGGAIGSGIQLVFPAHMNKLINFEQNLVKVQPGMIYSVLQQTLNSHGRFLPPYPSSISYSTIGGAVANNAGGEKSIKYGTTRDYVAGLRVVLSDGSLIETKRISARELSRKKGQTDLEGDIYRRVDGLLIDYAKEIEHARPVTSKNASGYNLWDLKDKDGSIDLSQLITGSQGTLGVITEITLKTIPYNPHTTLLVGYFDDIKNAGLAVEKLIDLKASAIELVDFNLIDYLKKNRPQDVEGLLPETTPQIILLVEFDDISKFTQAMKTRRAARILSKFATSQKATINPIEQDAYWQLRRSAAAVMWMNNSSSQALPFIEDGIVPVEHLATFLDKTYKLLEKYDLDIAVWGHAGDANLHLQPLLNLSKQKDIDKLFSVQDEFTKIVLGLGGSLSGEHNDGLIRGAKLKEQFGEEVYGLFKEIKDIFDPANIFNPGKKTDVDIDTLKDQVRNEYSIRNLYDNLPHN